ncbi:MAG TPA: lysophospholipid acyltransferase family protein [Candidatus Limnocylindria bacterium]|jgi:1-acyl-sn-glycerol-3-phosphate acyltransferase|nr:lysophospholipid acyltransferase family protein [Candidatus Limnocylindria bacterium]
MPDVGVPVRDRLGQYPRVPDITFDALRTIARWTAVALTKLQFPVEVRGVEPSGDRVALVANHQSHLDSLVILASLSERRRREIACLAAKDYFFEKTSLALASSLFVMAVAFDRTRYTELRRWTRILRDQKRGTLLVYPSGSRRRSEAHDAILFVLASSGWTIVPVAIAGTAKAWPVGRTLWRPFRHVRVTFGEPLSGTPTKDLAGTLAAFWRANAES